MKMDEVIARINVLAKKAKAEGLTPEELTERDKLRRIYIDSVKANLVGQLENTYILQPDGTYALPPQGETPLCAQEHFISHLPRFAPPRSQSLRCGEDDQKPHKGIFGLGSVLFRRKTK